ncbi:MAG: right-handed parallel beta-helix repeat-containing protein [Bacteroidota bacterium]
MKQATIFIFSFFILYACQKEKNTSLKKGLTITESTVILQDTFKLNGSDSLNQPLINIEGENITVDFNNAVLIGSNDKKWPNEFYGTAVLIEGKNITIKNANIHGFKIAVMANGVDSLKLVDCNFSYNFRQQLKSTREREDVSDWLSHHQNNNDEWLRYGAAIYLKKCNNALVKNINITGGQNGILMTECNAGLFYNNTFQFNSGLGIGMYRSNNNRIMHNQLDWNVRGYSHGIYQRGQDSAGILVYEQSNGNTFAYNSATHSGDGFFLWAGQTTMDTGKGGCNDNLIYKNDFSHAPTNGVEVTFSSNKVIENKMEECRYGIWGGYSFESSFIGNKIDSCNFGIAVEHGQNNDILYNDFKKLKSGIQLWERDQQPADWGYGKNKDIDSRDYKIIHNVFSNTEIPLKISSSKNVLISGNKYEGYKKILASEKPNKNLSMNENIINYNKEELIKKYHIDPLSDGIIAKLPADQLKGRQYILMDEWGPYDFRSPSIWLREIDGNEYTFLLLGPPTGNYKIVDGEGWAKLNRVSGAFPATLIGTKKEGAEYLTLELEFIGEAFTNRFGKYNKKGKLFPFTFKRFEKKFDWQTRFYNYDEKTDPLNNYEAFKNLKNKTPDQSETKKELYYTWWKNPHENINADKFATFSETKFEIENGTYKISLTSDDGTRLFLDGKLMIDHWDIHEPATDVIEVELGGVHKIEVEHFENAGFGTLGFRMEKT